MLSLPSYIRFRRLFTAGLLVSASALPAAAQDAGVTFERILHADQEPQNWLTHHHDYRSWRYSLLDEINRDTVKDLKFAFAVALRPPEGTATWPSSGLVNTPLVVDGMMYATDGWARVYKIDVSSGTRGSIRWILDPQTEKDTIAIPSNRGVAISGNRVYVVSLDGRLIAADIGTGETIFEEMTTRQPDVEYHTGAPLALKGNIIFGSGGADNGARNFIEARSAETGEIVWTRFTVPAPGEPGSETWKGGGESWKTGGGSIWGVGSYDEAQDLTIWGVGNPAPDFDPTVRPGDNLYTDSTIALDPDTGDLKWYFQYTPNDALDYDEVGSHLLIDATVDGQPRQLLSHASRNGFYYVLDRTSGNFLHGTQLLDQVNWTAGIDPKTGKPVEYDPNLDVQVYNSAKRPGPGLGGETVTDVCPQIQGGTNIFPQSYNPETGYVYSPAIEGCGNFGKDISIAAQQLGSVTALDPTTGKIVVKRHLDYAAVGGTLTTAGGLVFNGALDGTLEALDAKTMEPLWSVNMGTGIEAPPVTYAIDGKQYVAIPAGGGVVYSGFFAMQGKGKDPVLMENMQRSSMLFFFAL
jgi:alcohol dehydrogenase (cytochrome c)